MASAFTPAQLTKYLEYMALPATYSPYLNDPESFPKTEEALTALFRCQITRFPYDNLTLHYTATEIVDITPESIYRKFMEAGDSQPSGRGGYCLECSIFFNHVLRGLGFSVYTTGCRNRARVNGIPGGEFKGWCVISMSNLNNSLIPAKINITRTHIVNIIELPTGQQYHVDVAFGGDGPTRPIPLISGSSIQNLGTQEVRLVHGNIPKQSRKEQKLWIYQYRNSADRDWNSFYSFGEFEFFEDDFEVINRYTSWEAVARGNQWIVKFLRGGETGAFPVLPGELPHTNGHAGDDSMVQIVGKIMYVNGVVKLNMGGKTRVIDSLETQEEKLAGLKKWFGFSF
ncbi:hypothetical protein N7488_008643 [Penicillium malachiteum]|nr:hypothetical protein N7488_008643 [Penicillium malachiteum]